MFLVDNFLFVLGLFKKQSLEKDLNLWAKMNDNYGIVSNSDYVFSPLKNRQEEDKNLDLSYEKSIIESEINEGLRSYCHEK